MVRTAEGHTAFVPAPLPPSIAFDGALVLALSRADAALSELSGLGRQLPNPHLLIAQPLLYLSEYIERERRDYYDCLMRIRTHGDWTGWLHYFLAGVRWSARRAARQARKLMDLRDTMRRKVHGTPKALALVDELFANPHINAARVKALLGASDPTARAALAELERAGLIQETSGPQWGRRYLARGVLRAIEMPADEGHDE